MENANEKKWCVYIHTNKINNKAYIGITSRNPNDRWGNNGCHYDKTQPVFYNAIQKYGWDNFEHKIFADGLDEFEAKHMEKLLILLFKTNCRTYKNPELGYNMTDGGDGTLGRKCSEETRKKISEAKTGEKWSEERKIVTSKRVTGDGNPFFGKHHTEETKELLSNKAIEIFSDQKNHPMYGKKQSSESKRKSMESQKRRSVVLQFDLFGNYIATFQSLCEASRITKISRFSITRSCHGDIESIKGFIFKFEDPDDINRVSMTKNPYRRAVVQLDSNGFFLNEYCSLKDASQNTGLFAQNIGACCRGIDKTCGNFKWMYKEDYDLLLTIQN